MQNGPVRPPSENGLLDHTAFWLHRLSTAVLSRFEARLSEMGVTVAQWKVMIVLYRGDASTTFGVANFINVDGGSVTRVLDRLISKGLVTRTPSVDDRREVELSLTKAGQTLMSRQLLPIADVEDDRWLKGLSYAELLAFKGLLARLLAAQGIEVPERWVRSGLASSNSSKPGSPPDSKVNGTVAKRRKGKDRLPTVTR